MEKRRKTATRCGSSEKNGVRKAETQKVGIQLDDGEVKTVSKELRTRSSKAVEAENAKDVGTRISEETKREVKKKSIVNMIPGGSRAAEAVVGPKVELFRSAKKKYCFIRDTSFNDLRDKYELEAGSVLTEKTGIILAGPPYSTRSAQCQLSSVPDVFSKKYLEHAVKLLGGVRPPARMGVDFVCTWCFYH